MFEPVFTKEFLEKHLNREIYSFTVRPGSKAGIDNFMGEIYALDINLKSMSCLHESSEELELIHLVAKCYPKHPEGHEYLNRCNIFYKELSVYQILMYKFEMLLQTQNLKLRLPLAPFVEGKAVDFSKQIGRCSLDENGNVIKEFSYGPLDNFLLLTDVRKTLGFKMTDPHESLDWNHCRLIVKAVAKIHAISWAYQKKHGIERLSDKFNFLKQTHIQDVPIQENPLAPHFEYVLESLEEKSRSDSPLVAGTKFFQKNSWEILRWFQTDALEVNGVSETDLNMFMRVPPVDDSNNYVPWRTLIHGDLWSNNILFKYDSDTRLPTEVILVDYQASNDACPTIDLAYMMYICTDQQFRQKYLDKVLEEYHDNFQHFCNLLNVELLPGFCMESLRKRFHRSKLYAFCLSVVVLPNILKQHNNHVEDNFSVISNNFSKNNLFKQRITEIVKDLYSDGII